MWGLTLAGSLVRGPKRPARRGPKDTSIIWLFLNGGPSHYETFDPKPDNPLPFRSVVGAVKTNVPGTLLGGLFKNLSQHADKFSLIRSYTHGSADHADATHFLMTGHAHARRRSGAAEPAEPGGRAFALSRSRRSHEPAADLCQARLHLCRGPGLARGCVQPVRHPRQCHG